jgi:hypothetical protein
MVIAMTAKIVTLIWTITTLTTKRPLILVMTMILMIKVLVRSPLPLFIISIHAFNSGANCQTDESDEEQSTSSRGSRALPTRKRKSSQLDDGQATKRAKTSRKGKGKAVNNSAPHNPRSFGDEGNNFNFQNSLSYDLPPLITTRAIFEALTKRIFRTSKANLGNFCQIFAQTPLKVLTFCSGTESPILGLQMVQKSKFSPLNLLESSTKQFLGLRAKYGEQFKFVFDHEGSAEIHPAKAAYIQRNFPSKAILRDIIELVLDEDPEHPRTM